MAAPRFNFECKLFYVCTAFGCKTRKKAVLHQKLWEVWKVWSLVTKKLFSALLFSFVFRSPWSPRNLWLHWGWNNSTGTNSYPGLHSCWWKPIGWDHMVQEWNQGNCNFTRFYAPTEKKKYFYNFIFFRNSHKSYLNTLFLISFFKQLFN